MTIPRFLDHFQVNYPVGLVICFPLRTVICCCLTYLPWYFAYNICFTCSPVVEKLVQSASNKYYILVYSPALCKKKKKIAKIFSVVWIMHIINIGNKRVEWGNQEIRQWKVIERIYYFLRRLKFVLQHMSGDSQQPKIPVPRHLVNLSGLQGHPNIYDTHNTQLHKHTCTENKNKVFKTNQDTEQNGKTEQKH